MSENPQHDGSDNGGEGVGVSKSAASKLFDLRYLIGALFTVYGIVLIIVGLFDSSAEVKKAAGVHINLWTGIGMLVVGLIFLAWARLRPLGLGEGQSDATSEDEGRPSGH